MRVLAIDIGTGTQDILLFDSQQPIENSLKMIMPSPTVIVAGRIREATRRGVDLLLTGVTMGGGQSAWAVEEHLRQGHRVFATDEAARTLNDDLAAVATMGVRIVGEDEAANLAGAEQVTFRDFDFAAIAAALAQFGVAPALDAVAVAVFDHGAAPSGVSDRLFRFEYLAKVVSDGDGLSSFAYLRSAIPASLTRMHAVASCLDLDVPLLLMDTGPAAALGALEDEIVATAASALIVNVGNFHTLAFHVCDGRIAGLFEHHTGMLDEARLTDYLRQLCAGSITNQAVFDDSGHGALLVPGARSEPELVAVTGPRRSLLRVSALRPHFPAPHGDMMAGGCFGLLRALAAHVPEFADDIVGRLA